MLVSKTKIAFTLVLGVALFGLGGSALVWHSQAADRGDVVLSKTSPARSSPDDNLRSTLLALDEHIYKASEKGDWREIEKFLADDLVTISVLGRYGKTDAVEAAKHTRGAERTIADAEVIRTGKDAAVLTYRYSCKILSNDGKLRETCKNHRVMYVWANRDGGWVIVFCHDDHGRQPKADAANFSQYQKFLDELYDLKSQPQKSEAEPNPPMILRRGSTFEPTFWGDSFIMEPTHIIRGELRNLENKDKNTVIATIAQVNFTLQVPADSSGKLPDLKDATVAKVQQIWIEHKVRINRNLYPIGELKKGATVHVRVKGALPSPLETMEAVEVLPLDSGTK